MIRPRTSLLVFIVTALAASACGAPEEPLHVGMREVASNVVLGGGEDEEVVAPAPVPPTAISVTVPQPTKVGEVPPADDSGEAPAPGGAPPPPPSPEPRGDDGDGDDGAPPSSKPKAPAPPPPPPAFVCKKGDPRDPARIEARRDELIPPVEATYTYRNKGGFEVSGPDANEGKFDQPTQRKVAEVEVSDDGSFTYSVAATLGATVTTTTYRYQSKPTVAGGGDVLDQADAHDGRGLYLDKIKTQDGESDPTEFDPRPDLLLLPVPATDGFATDVAGTDPTSGTSMSYRLTVVGKQRVDACGEQLDSIRVTLTDGRYAAPTSAVDFTSTYDIGTQFGGLMLRDAFVTAGREGLNNVSRNNVATINEAPRVQKAAR